MDANVVASGLIRPSGPPGRVLRYFLARGAFDWVLSPAIFEEYRRVLAYSRIRKYLRDGLNTTSWLSRLSLLGVWVENRSLPGSVPKDSNDEIYVAAAVEGLAEVLVSGDRHLLDLGRYEATRILKPVDFLRELR